MFCHNNCEIYVADGSNRSWAFSAVCIPADSRLPQPFPACWGLERELSVMPTNQCQSSEFAKAYKTYIDLYASSAQSLEAAFLFLDAF